MVIEWICDCCGAYETQFSDRIIVGQEDRCEDCTVHAAHCDEQRALKLVATEWFTIAGRGTVAAVDMSQASRPVNVGENVVIDGTLYTVQGIEYSRILTSPPIIDPHVGLVVKRTNDSEMQP